MNSILKDIDEKCDVKGNNTNKRCVSNGISLEQFLTRGEGYQGNRE